jgi:hypothetical protein
LMIIGNRTSMSELAKQLQAAVDAQSAEQLPNWPPVVASPDVDGPYKDVPDFKLSFHLLGKTPLDQIAPLRRRSPPGLFLVAIVVCALAGAVSIALWALAL